MEYDSNYEIKLKGGRVILFVDNIEIHSIKEYFPNVTGCELEKMKKAYPTLIQDADLNPFLFCCYLIQMNGKSILVDTGVGPVNMNRQPREQHLLYRLSKRKIKAEEIDVVLFTHLHPDHVGWNTRIDENGKYFKTFKNAEYIAHVGDYESIENGNLKDAFHPDIIYTQIKKLKEGGMFTLVKENRWNVTESIRLVKCQGHTPGSSYIEVSDGSKIVILVGDIFSNPLQVENPELAYCFDMDKDQASNARKYILYQYAGKETYLCSGHFGMGKIQHINNGLRWEAL